MHQNERSTCHAGTRTRGFGCPAGLPWVRCLAAVLLSMPVRYLLPSEVGTHGTAFLFSEASLKHYFLAYTTLGSHKICDMVFRTNKCSTAATVKVVELRLGV